MQIDSELASILIAHNRLLKSILLTGEKVRKPSDFSVYSL